MTFLPDVVLEPIVRMALAEDLGRAGDVTTLATVDPDLEVHWVLRARSAGILAGLDAATLTLRLIDPAAVLQPHLKEGAVLAAGDVIATLHGKAQSLLMAERVMLNFLGPLSGIASLTARYVEAVKGTNAKITCTRKTTPGLRALQKKAVRLGGGSNHRFGLDDAILIKDNHVAAAGGIVPALTRAKAYGGHLLPIEVEVDSLNQLEEALPFAPTCIMLDNFTLADLRTAVARVAGAVTLEASGGVSLSTVADIAATGVDYISVGALTHSAPCLDLGLDEA
ncbi:MAG: carboxylating nicotinate-nucleotide diphosphorylase [Aquidulcibacter sp.]|jgi:nicotinate-nucleotide pyrophosphorylase (carboxylating)|uniref:carboxylating nicotinate-nucleotide diphosphorylase n=1 Tax=Aquidulcibacter sp. TaxID=2052990 RepID=UPI0022C7361F|nr:carboxylating nicotinate-nucleotide diphosphorylase [Aquidulcibacter sp.]MCE2889700.1 carboxylating nicotinate-nucleotide diphosphorylase [Hyphomonadaceae bacterium]MCZ8208809.1 carboxylating nicotinate-nucleotide diphosphorylase [Aquidulcibacter sp.]